ncbi:vWA domain-containing protein [Conchiformibius steedae]|uniref:vWA domain-containing protein n=1 Tax=Conchiformibius steedae TaxID=153493 RepID=UPI00047D5933|nr:VWA domain-containing protein [Conchiformibius steedae]QMT32593.1 VWA domain-containing protein [Conchiformibius steedae]
MSRRLLTYICIDTSGSMRGEPIEAVNTGLQSLMASLRQNPYALESVHLSITTFDSHIKTVLPLTPLEQVVLPEIVCPESGATFLGGVLEHIADAVRRDRIVGTPQQKGDWRPILIVLTDGKPTDLLVYSEIIPTIKQLGFGNIVACAAGPKADAAYLKQLTDTVVSLDIMDAASFAKFFQWVSAAVASTSVSVGSSVGNELPPPPPEINVVL